MPPTRSTPLVVLAAVAQSQALKFRNRAADWRDLARDAVKRPSTHPDTRKAGAREYRGHAAALEREAGHMDQIAARLTALIPKAATPGKVPRGYIEFRVYQGGSHAYNWKALRGGNIIAHATGYDRKRDSVRQVKAIIAAIQAGKCVITQAGKGTR
jgi:hypothetical protein